MHPELKTIFQQLEAQRNEILSKVDKLSPDQYTHSKNGKWSIAQILTHLITAEKLSLNYMKKKSLGVDSLDNSGILDDARYYLLKASQYVSFLKYKAPKVVIENTPVALNQAELKSEWEKLRSDLKAFLEKIEEKNIRKKIYKHAVAGRLNVKHAISFFEDHFNHHLPQIKRLL